MENQGLALVDVTGLMMVATELVHPAIVGDTVIASVQSK